MRALPLVLLVTLVASGCIPYAVGTTAETVPEGEIASSSTYMVIPGGVEFDPSYEGDRVDDSRDETDVPVPYAAAGARFGVGPNTDIGVYSPGFSGVVVNVKQQLQRAEPGAPLGVALMGGAGVINYGLHAYLEATAIVSGREDVVATPYGGVRIMQTIPLSSEAVSDTPAAGGFGGVRLGDRDLGVSAEVGVFYDRSALGLRERDVVVVPSVTLHGDRLFRILRGF